MDYSYSFLILLLPALSFLVLGLCGMKMSHKLAGLIGTTVLGVVTVISYVVAFTYYTSPRLADGSYQAVVPFNFTWLPLGNLHFDMGMSVSIGGAIICCSAFAINDFRMVVIGLIGTWINGLVINYFTASINNRKRVCIISQDWDRLCPRLHPLSD